MMHAKRCAAALAAGLMWWSAAQADAIDQRVDALLKRMTLDEKVGQLNQLSGRELTGPASDKNRSTLDDIRSGRVGSMLNVKGVKETREVQAEALKSRLGIPLLFSLDVIHGYQTVFPVPLGEAASWDLKAIEQASHVAAREAAASGIHWTFAPMVDVSRDPRWGRVMEGAGEDTCLGARIAAARVRGFQGEKLGATDAVMAPAKHFAAYGAAEAGRDYNAVDMSEQQLFEVYLPPFKAALDAGAATFMNSFNTLNGVPATGNAFLQRDILKGRWNFKGFVVSDWGSVREMVSHGYAADAADAAQKAIAAGSDMDMESQAYIAHLAELVRAKRVPVAQVDDAVRRILRKKFELGLFDDPYRFSDPQREQAVLSDPQHALIARDIAQKSLVLLKNQRHLLPLAKDVASIAVIGPLADSRRDMEGGWIVKSDPARVVTVLDGIKRKLAPAAHVLYAQGSEAHGDSTAGFGAALDAARQAEVVVLAIGETWDMSGEAKSRSDIGIPGPQRKLFEALKATGKPIVVLLFAGRPLVFDSVAEQADAIVYAWLPGAEGGNAIANVLFGDTNPSGKLPVTLPRSAGQIPLTYRQYPTGRPVVDESKIVYKSAYIDSPNTPRYAFGYGLSYTDFAYSDLKLSKASMRPSETLTLSMVLANTGKVAGEEVVQLYLRDLVASVARPLKELKGFQKIRLEPGERKTVTFMIDKSMLSFFNRQLQWVAEPGRFELMLGSASDDIRLHQQIELLAR